jgi:hypothetical protein
LCVGGGGGEVLKNGANNLTQGGRGSKNVPKINSYFLMAPYCRTSGTKILVHAQNILVSIANLEEKSVLAQTSYQAGKDNIFQYRNLLRKNPQIILKFTLKLQVFQIVHS